MIRRTPTIPAPTPQRWQSRAEIFKAYLESLPPSELLRVRPSYYALHFGWAARKHSYARKAGFDPDSYACRREARKVGSGRVELVITM
jgi:hypothetical protein